MKSFKKDSMFARVSRMGFTLMEVNLAIFIMAVGLLAMVAIYPLAYRESQQSQDDVKASAVADCVLNTLTAALSSRNITWNDWETGVSAAMQVTDSGEQGGGWLSYCDRSGNVYTPKRLGPIKSKAEQVFNKLAGIYNKSKGKGVSLDFANLGIPTELACAIVAQWGSVPVWEGNRMISYDDRSRVAISVRLTRRAGELLSQPIFYTEIHFQGDQNTSQNTPAN